MFGPSESKDIGRAFALYVGGVALAGFVAGAVVVSLIHWLT